VWIIFYKNSVSLNVYSRLKFFTWLQFILTFPNSRQVDPLGKADDPSSLLGMITMKMGIRKDRQSFEWHVCLHHFIFIYFLPQYSMMICLWLIQCSRCTKWAHEGCTTYRGFDSYFLWQLPKLILIFQISFALLEWSIRFIQGSRVKRMISLFLI